MKKWLVIIFLLVFLPQTSAAAADSNQVPASTPINNDYVLHSGDIVAINVYGYPELSFPSMGQPEGLTIRPDGKITYPFLGEIVAEGITAKQLSGLLTDRLGTLYVNPTVSVNLMRFGTDRVYVLGEVNAPGSYELDKSRNLLDAIGAAKGWTKDAAKTKVFVIRKNQKGEPPLKVNLMGLLKDGDTSKNIPLQQGDVVFLTGNNRIDFVRDIVPIINAAYLIYDIGRNNN
jgi:polysaccharide biosynthesis/export protein